MAQRIKKQLFRILPLSMVGLMVLVLAVGVLYNSSLTVRAVVGEGTATISDGNEVASAGVTAERIISDTFTVILTVGASGIAIDAASPTFTVPASFTAPDATATAGALTLDGNWSATAAGGTCAVTTGTSTASGQVMTVDVTGACATIDTITLTYKGVSATNMGATPVTVSTADILANGAAVAIGASPTITVTDTTVPTISAVSIPDAPMKVGDVVTATITTGTDNDTYTLTSGTVGGFTLGGLLKTGPTTYTATFTITEGGADVAAGANVPVANLVLTDTSLNPSATFAGSVSPAGVADSIDANTPTYSVTSVSPTSGNTAKVGDSIVVTVTAGALETGLTASGVQTVNGVASVFAEVGLGVYTITYTVIEGDADILDATALPVSITLTDAAGNIGANIASIIAGSAPGIDANTPVVTALVVAPNTGTLKIGDTVTLNITADAAGYTATNITLNDVDITASNFQDLTGGAYSADYIIANYDLDVSSGAITASVVLTDAATNSNVAFTTVTANTLVIDANSPTYTVGIVSPASGNTAKVGDSVVINLSAGETGLTASGVQTVNGVTSSFLEVGGGFYSITYIVVEGNADISDAAVLPVNIVFKDAAGNIGNLFTTIGIVKAPGIDANSPIIGGAGTVTLTIDVNADGIASIGDTLTYAAGALGGAPDTDVWTVDLFVYGIACGAACAPGAYVIVADAHDGVPFAATETVTDDAGNTDTGSVTLVGFADIDNVIPVLDSLTIYSDNADPTLAVASNTVYLEFNASEILNAPTVVFSSGGVVVTNIVAVGDDGVTCGDSIGGDDTWTACYVVDSGDTAGAVTFNIDATDLASNPSGTYTETDIIDGSSVDVDLSLPSLVRTTFRTQTPADPNTDTMLWYNYTGDTFEAYVQGNENLSEVRVCIQSLTGVDPTATCDDTDFSAGVLGTDYISSGPIGASNSYTFTGGFDFETIAGQPLTPMTGYSMNILILDSAGNPYASANPADAFVMVWNVEPSVLDPVIANVGTTLWSGISDFTNVIGLTFRAEAAGPTLLGQLLFPGSINLTDSATVTALQTFATNVHVRGGDAADGAVDISVNAGAIAALNQPANLTIAVPGALSQPGMVVYDDTDTQCGVIANDVAQDSAVAINVCGDAITQIHWDNGTKLLTFSTDGFSGFGADITVSTPTFSPLDNATGVAISANLVLTFDEDVQVGTGNVVIKKTADDSIVETIDIAGALVTFNGTTGVTINPTANLLNSTGYYVQIANTAILDSVGNAFAGIADTTTWNFTTVAPVTGGGGDYTSPADTTPPTNTSISINSGAVETSSQNVTLTLGATDAAQMMISNSADFSGASWETYATSKTWILTVGTGTKTVYARFKDAAGNISISASDTINSAATTEIPADNVPGLILTDPTPAPALPQGVSIGSLVKRADMTSVYFIDQDNRRHAFPNAAVYLSYYPDFSGIQTISTTIMAEIPLGNNVTMRPGTYLVKIQSDPKVYAVEPYGVLKQIGSEAIATSLYGAGWATRIVDVEPTFFSNYQIGSVITTAALPTGSAFSYAGDSKVYYVDGGNKRYVSSGVFSHNNFQNRFIIRNVVTSNTYPDGADLPSHGMETIMTLR